MRLRVFVALLAFSLLAAACGSAESSSTPTLATQAPSTDTTEVESTEVESTEVESTEVESTDTTAPSTDEAAGAADDDQGEAAAPAVNLFPDIDVLNIADGATVNLAMELGGGDKATLLWFFAPH